MNVKAVVAVAIGFFGAWYLDARSWRRKPREELVGMLESEDWRFHKAAIAELRRRGEDLGVYMPRIVGRLGSESKVVRAAALATIKGVFPELAAELRGYSPSEATEVCREKAAGLVARYPLDP